MSPLYIAGCQANSNIANILLDDARTDYLLPKVCKI